MSLRRLFAGAATIVVLALVGGVVAFGHGEPSPSVHLAGGSAWFATPHDGSLALLDGATGSRVTRIGDVAKADGDFVVEQAGSAALVVDRQLGTVTRIDGATWTASPPLHVVDGPDPKLAVRTGGDAAWVLAQGGTVVQQIDPRSATRLGLPESLPAAVTDVAASSDGTLWAVAGSGELRSFRDGQAATTASVLGGDGGGAGSGQVGLALVGRRPVAVDLATARAVLVDADRGTADHPVCLDVDTATPPAIGGATDDAPWLLAVGPTAGTLVVSDVDADRCQVVALGPTSTAPRYGQPVERDHLVFVPDFVAGQVIVIDPAAAPGDEIKARVDLGLAGSQIDLFVHDDHVWFDQVGGDKAGVITDDLKALTSSKADPGSAQGQTPRPSPTPAPAGGQAGTNGAPVAAPTNPKAAPRGAGQTAAGLPAPPDNGAGATAGDAAGGGDAGGGGDGGGGDGGGGGAATVDFTASPAVAGRPVTFTDATVGDHTVTQWSATGGSPPSATSGDTFTTSFTAPGTFNVTLTVDTPNGAQSVSHTVKVDAQLTVPDLHGLSTDQARTALGKVGLTLGQSTSTVDSPLQSGLIFDSNPAKDSPVEPGTTINFRSSQAKAFFDFAVPAPGNDVHGVTTGPDGNVWMTVAGANKILQITPDGDVHPITIPTPNSQPWGITVGPDKNIWFTEHAASKVGRISPATGQVTGEFTTQTANAQPSGIASGPGNELWFAETAAGKVGHVTTAGQVGEVPASQPGSQPDQAVQGTDGNVYISENNPSRVSRVNPNGAAAVPVQTVSQPITQLLAAPDSSIWFATDGAVFRFPIGSTGPPPSIAVTGHVNSLGVGPDGFVWYSTTSQPVSDPTVGNNAGAIISLTSALQARKSIASPATADLFDTAPRFVMGGPGGMLWYFEAERGRLARIVLP